MQPSWQTDFVVRVKSDLDLNETASFFWTDSEIVLAWHGKA